ncbi:DMT family transporter [Cognatishimia sp. D5M38]|uniref:DMT family transporter n=2 Tax=Cognatishimia TaxID=2211635 RepID=A0A975ENG5_9RHOB|nr:DMT family transporter [Cognatishimia activa]QTN35311.1 DMT family transporter [Cognatishimia activa]
MTTYALIMLLTGVGIPILAALNAALGQHLGHPVAASVILFAVAFVLILIAGVITNPWAHLSGLASAPKHLLLAGSLIVFYVLSVTYIGPRFGIGNAVFFVLLGQMISAAAIDHFGLFNAQISPLTLTRASGIAIMAFGLWLIQKA